ncbi:MAG TPA: MBL fold metallo-hydrolase [Chthoniobacterales bacterium]
MRCAGPMVRALLIWLLALQSVSGGRARYRDLVLADPHRSRSSLGKVGINYLGTNAYRFETAGHVLLVDPYFSRLGLGAFVFPAPITPKLDRINAAANFISGADVILATHGHVDHLLGVPPIMQMTGARLLASPTAVESSGQFFNRSRGDSPLVSCPISVGSCARRGAKNFPAASFCLIIFSGGLSVRKLAWGVRHPLLLIAVTPVLPQLIGSIFNIWYNSVVAQPLLGQGTLRERFLVTVMVYNGLVYPAACGLWVWWIFSFRRLIRVIHSDRAMPEVRLIQARRRAIHLPWLGAIISAAGWLLAIPRISARTRGRAGPAPQGFALAFADFLLCLAAALAIAEGNYETRLPVTR